jgi:hypothetical protein
MAELEKGDQPQYSEKEKLMSWMLGHGLDIGVADTFDELLNELDWQIESLRDMAKREGGNEYGSPD